MMLQQRHTTSIRFRRFTNKAYAAFASMHREVTIGHVSSHICDKELLKSGQTNKIPCANFSKYNYLSDDDIISTDCDELTLLEALYPQSTLVEIPVRISSAFACGVIILFNSHSHVLTLWQRHGIFFCQLTN